MTIQNLIPAPVRGGVTNLQLPTISKFADQVQRALGQWPLFVEVTVGAENVPGAGDRVFTFRVMNSALQRCTGVFMLMAYLGVAEGDEPDGTQTTEWLTGVEVAGFIADRSWLVVTELDGTATLRVNVSGAGTRYAMAFALPPAQAIGPVAWT